MSMTIKQLEAALAAHAVATIGRRLGPTTVAGTVRAASCLNTWTAGGSFTGWWGWWRPATSMVSAPRATATCSTASAQ